MQARTLKRPFFAGKSLDRPRSGSGFIFLVIFFLAGAAIGSFAGSFSETPVIISAQAQGVKSTGSQYIELLWDNSRFHLAAVFLSTTFLGVFLLPALSAVRGYLIGCTASAIMCGYPETGFLLTLAALGFPLLVCLPGYLILASDSFSYSARLMSYTRGASYVGRLPGLHAHCVFCFASIVVWTLLQLYILPLIIGLII